MTIGMRAIETTYNGVRFRSRLEARWAVFFDALGIKWEYEPEGFEFGDGTRYLPDFFLPKFEGGIYAEVKPPCETGALLGGADPFYKARRFVREGGGRIWLCAGRPDFRVSAFVCRGEHYGDSWGCAGAGYCDDCADVAVIPSADQARGEQRFYWAPGYEDADGTFPSDQYPADDPFPRAVAAARAHRFWDLLSQAR